ncbi:nose resistant to fluoxetine protein 6-like [Oppia nitens]|uniref:nose resistant to fluoxetine protein 6-like n=1 Tax=Oppia nitens TaxID=1686743 RepID=UPI0023D9F647|nr:nose resistant to fluoxetine protein 6-like [Oppia nitens]
MILHVTTVNTNDGIKGQDYTTAVNQLLGNNDNNEEEDDDDYYSGDDYGDDEEDDDCTVDLFVDHYTELLLPEDYEESKKLNFTQKSFTFPEVIEKVKRLHKYQQNVTNKLNPLIKKVMPRLSELIFYVDLPVECMTALARVGQAVQNGDRWAIKFMDSSPIGQLDPVNYNSLPFGEYEECITIESPREVDKSKIYGKYCALGIPTNLIPDSRDHQPEDNKRVDQMLLDFLRNQFNNSDVNKGDMFFLDNQLDNGHTDGHFYEGIIKYMEYMGAENIRLPPGLCIPTVCDAKDVEYAINKVLYPLTHMNIIINEDCDYIGKPFVINNYQIISLTFILSIIMICSVCTVVYSLRKTTEKTSNSRTLDYIVRITDCFALIPNIRSVFVSPPKQSPNRRFSSLDGIRAVLCFWMFVQNEYEGGYLPLHTIKLKESATYKFHNQLKYIMFINWNLNETFFLIGGFLCSYLTLNKLDQTKGIFDYIKYALSRYFRIIPAVLVAIAITLLFELMGDGPIWPLINQALQKPCIENPSPTIFMFNNYGSFPDVVTCVPVTWYISTDFQLYLIAPIFILVLYYYPIVGIIWTLFFGVTLGSLIALAPKYLLGIPHIFEGYRTLNFDTMVSSLSHHYWGIEPHFQVYTLGLLLGFMVKKYPKLNLGGYIGESVLWIVTWSMTGYALFWHRNYFRVTEYVVNNNEILLWVSLSKLCYSAGWMWAIYACCTARAGFINQFFGWRGFRPISHLMLEIYLLRLFTILFRIGTAREQVFYSDYYVLSITIFDFAMTCLFALIVNVLVTKPFANLLQLAFVTNHGLATNTNGDISLLNEKDANNNNNNNNNNVVNDVIY